jgi:hypothetical protein
MGTLTRTVWKSDNYSGSPGYLSFYMQGALSGSGLDAAVAAQKTMLSAVNAVWPTGVTCTLQPDATQLDDTNGQLIQPVGIATPPAPIVGAGGTNYASPAGVCVCWRTGALVVRRLMIGRLFLVPVSSTLYGPDGTLADASRAAVLVAATTYVNRLAGLADGHPMVWHRPTKGASNGFSRSVTFATVNDRVSILRSRRAR